MQRILTIALALTPAMAFAQITAPIPVNTAPAKKDDTTRKTDTRSPDQMMTDARIASILHKVNKPETDARTGISRTISCPACSVPWPVPHQTCGTVG